MRIFNVFAILTFAATASLGGQTNDVFHTEGITSALHRANIGRITFMAEVIPIEQYSEKDFLTSFDLKENCDFNIRTFMGNSLGNYLHELAPELSPEQLNKNGNYQFSFFVDDTLIYKENIPAGAGGAESKQSRTVFRVPFISTSNEDSWGRFLWNRFMLRGGEDALDSGKHVLNIEIRPYLKTTTLKLGDLIAQGQIKINVVKREVDEKAIAIQQIKAGSGWQLSNDNYDKDAIRELNLKIAQNTFKAITSVVVVKDGGLLIEEYFNGANRDTKHDPRSATKSFTSALMGIAIQEKHIKNENQTLRSFYDLSQFSNYSAGKESVTLRSLLTMSSKFDGSDLNEDSPGNEEKMYPTTNWVKFVLDLPIDATKATNTHWDYFTAGVILLGDILNKSVPGGLEHYSALKLFEPLGITNFAWQYTPQHVVNTAGSLQMSSLDYAKFGQLYRNGGSWNGQQIISKGWIEATFTKYLEVPDRTNEYYGYLFWNKTYAVGRNTYETWYCSGNGGNSIFIFKDIPIVVVITSTAYNQPYAHSQVDKIMERYVLPAVTK
jgi:CubicO group peptidase (beta-lactamase class C family)